jgi:hypothetical protein
MPNGILMSGFLAHSLVRHGLFAAAAVALVACASSAGPKTASAVDQLYAQLDAASTAYSDALDQAGEQGADAEAAQASLGQAMDQMQQAST